MLVDFKNKTQKDVSKLRYGIFYNEQIESIQCYDEEIPIFAFASSSIEEIIGTLKNPNSWAFSGCDELRRKY